MLNINPNALSFVAVGQRICEAEKRGVPLTLDFTATNQYMLNLENMQARNFVGMIRAMFTDNTSGTQSLLVANGVTGQTVQVPPGLQGYLNLLAPNPCQLIFTSASNVVIPVTLLNYEVFNTLW